MAASTGCATARVAPDGSAGFVHRLARTLSRDGLKCEVNGKGAVVCAGGGVLLTWIDYDATGRRLVAYTPMTIAEPCSEVAEKLRACNREHTAFQLSCVSGQHKNRVFFVHGLLVPEAGFAPDEVRRYLEWRSFMALRLGARCGLLEASD